jgi:hypothetical protein
MNERIQELMKQSMVEYQFQHRFSPEKFAELIVKECFDVVINDGRFHDAKGIIRAGKGVAMEHFGVEE